MSVGQGGDSPELGLGLGLGFVNEIISILGANLDTFITEVEGCNSIYRQPDIPGIWHKEPRC